MAIVQNPLIGRASGSAGGATFQHYDGKNIIRRKPSFFVDNPSPAQVEHRLKFKRTVIKFDGELEHFLYLVFPTAPRLKSRFTVFSEFLHELSRLVVVTPYRLPRNYMYGGRNLRPVFDSYISLELFSTDKILMTNVLSDVMFRGIYVDSTYVFRAVYFTVSRRLFIRPINYSSSVEVYYDYFDVVTPEIEPVVFMSGITDSKNLGLPGTSSLSCITLFTSM